MENKNIAKCLCCGKEFERVKNAQKFCSTQCRKKHYYQSSLMPTFNLKVYECAWCGVTFEYDRKVKYCSMDCRLRANRRRTKRNKNTASLEQVAKLAREAGLSYGKYVAKMGL